MTALLTQIIRTVVPLAVGALVTWLISLGLDIPKEVQEQTSITLTVLVTSLYYIAVAALEKKIPAFGWLLGVARNPVYTTPEQTAVVLEEGHIVSVDGSKKAPATVLKFEDGQDFKLPEEGKN